MRKVISYNGHEIALIIELNTGSKEVSGVIVITHTLSCTIDGDPLLEKEGLADAELIEAIPVVTTQAERRIDIIGSPEDSPLVAQLMAMGFELEP